MQLSSARAMQNWQTPAQAQESANPVLNMSCLCDQQDVDKLLYLMMLLGFCFSPISKSGPVTIVPSS